MKISQTESMEWQAEWVAVSECSQLVKLPVDGMPVGIDEAACRIADRRQSFCLVLQSNGGDRGMTAIEGTHRPDELIVVYKGRAAYGNVRKKKFVPLDTIGECREIHRLQNRSLLVGNLGFYLANSVDDLTQKRHPYSRFIKLELSAQALTLEYEDHRLEPQTLRVPFSSNETSETGSE